MKHPTPPARSASTQRAAARATVPARLAMAPPSSPLRGARVSQWSGSSAASAVASRRSSVLRHAREYQTTAPPGRLTPSPPRISLLRRAGNRVSRAAGVGRRRGGCNAAVPRRSAPRRARRLRRGSSRALERRRRGRRQPSPPESASAPAAGSPPRRRRRHAVGCAEEGELIGVPWHCTAAEPCGGRPQHGGNAQLRRLQAGSGARNNCVRAAAAAPSAPCGVTARDRARSARAARGSRGDCGVAL